MRIGNGKVIEKTSGKWRGDQVGSIVFGPGCTDVTPPPLPTRQLGTFQPARPNALRSPQDLRTHAIRAAQIRASQALDELREAHFHEANEEGQWVQAIADMQDHAHALIAGCDAMLKEIEGK